MKNLIKLIWTNIKLRWQKAVLLVQSKAWWKSQLKFRWTILFNGWLALYGIWLLLKIVTYGFYDLPVSRFLVVNGYLIAFLWFFFWQLNLRTEKRQRKLLWKIIKLEEQRADEAFAFIRKLQDAVEEEEKNNKGGVSVPPKQ